MSIRRLALTVLVMLPATLLGAARASCQSTEGTDGLWQEIELLNQLNEYGLSLEQVKAMLPIVRDLDTRRRALEDLKHSEKSLAPMRALRDALLKGSPTGELQAAADEIWNELADLDGAFEEAVPEATAQVVKLLTDDQLAELAADGDLGFDEADRILQELETARAFDQPTFDQWRDRTARDVATRGKAGAAGQGLQADLAAFLDRARKLTDDEYADQADTLFAELEALIAGATPKPTRETLETHATEQLEYILREPRLPALLEAYVTARGG